MAIAIAAATISVERNIWTCDRQEFERGGKGENEIKYLRRKGHGLAARGKSRHGVDTYTCGTHTPKKENSLIDQLCDTCNHGKFTLASLRRNVQMCAERKTSLRFLSQRPFAAKRSRSPTDICAIYQQADGTRTHTLCEESLRPI